MACAEFIERGRAGKSPGPAQPAARALPERSGHHDDREISLARAFLEARHAKGDVPAPSLIEIFVELTGIEPVTS
jgi:hypothetical protein